MALRMIGLIVEPYDIDRTFPVFGVGGIPRHMGMNETSYCFPLNGLQNAPEIVGIETIFEAYRQTMP